MKNIIAMTKKIVLAGLLATATFTSCSNSSDAIEAMDEQLTPAAQEPIEKIELTTGEEACRDAANGLALEMLASLHEQGRGTVVSPLSLTVLLGMLSNGATPQTQQEIRSLLGLSGDGLSAINGYCQKMLAQVPLRDPLVTIEQGNALFLNTPRQVSASYMEHVGATYSPSIQTLDFGSPSAVDEVNRWASSQTHGLIPGLLQQGALSAGDALCAVNALFFQAPWASRFDKANTRQEAFADGAAVSMMQQEGVFLYGEDASSQTLRLPYSNGSFSMTVVLPHEGVALADLLPSLDTGSWSTLQRRVVDVRLPRMSTEFTAREKLTKWLAARVPSAFRQSEGFSGLCKDETVQLSGVMQKSRLMADEDGATAAAATDTDLAMASEDHAPAPLTFHANRPFVYAITESSTGTILFIGTYYGGE